MPYANPIEAADCKRRWAAENPKKVTVSRARWKAENPEAVREQSRKDMARRRAKDPEGFKAYGRAYRDKNKVRMNARRKELRAQNVEHFKDREHKNKYGISLQERDELFKAQGCACAACGGTDPIHKLGWQLDHNHETGKIRGILCHSCNVALGQAKECAARLRALADYIERHQ